MATVSLQSVIDDARQAIETGAADKAIGMARHLLAHYPRLIEGWRLLGEAYLNQGLAADAAHAFEQVLAADPENVAAYYGLGLARQSLDQPEATIQAFERALEIQPNLAELRTQLLRLYAEVPGSAGQFRLSRAGLARLYARGGMFGQAVDEFRAVLDAEPDRDDVKVALAEALWRDGQEDEAMDFCREILAQRPDLLKPTLLLGYMLFAAGDPRGEELWRRAAEQDPSLTMARSLFDILPPIRLEEPVLPEFDEAEWRAQEARRAAEAAAQATAPVAAVTAGAAATQSDVADDLFADSWLFSTSFDAQPRGQEPATADVASAPPADDDEALLASLLGFGENGSEASHAPSQEPAFAPASAATQASAPRSEETATLDEIGLPEAGDIDLDADLKPFSLDEWDEQELPAASADSQQSAVSEDLSGIQPFSLDAATAETDVAGIEPFRLDDLDSAPSATASSPGAGDESDLGGVQPFSLEDWAAADADRAPSQPGGQAGDEAIAGLAPFSLEDWANEEQAPTAPAATDAPAGVAPFSLEDLDLGGETGAPSTAAEEETLQGLEPFSLEEFSLDVLEEESTTELAGPGAEEEPSTQARRDFRWEEPSWRRQAAQQEGGAPAEGESIFARLLSRREQLGGVSRAETTPSPSDQDLFFSMDDEPLRPDWDTAEHGQTLATGGAPAGEAPDRFGAEPRMPEATTGAPDDGQDAGQDTDAQPAPFSLADLGFEDETVATDADAQPAPFSLADLGLEDETVATDADTQPAAEGDGEPFSLADLGLSDEEMQLLEPSSTATPQTPEHATDVSAEDEPTPFSLADLGLSDDDLAALGIDSTPQAEAGAQADETTEAELPFSLADLGLDEEQWTEAPSAEEHRQAPAAPASAPGEATDADLLDSRSTSAPPTPEEEAAIPSEAVEADAEAAVVADASGAGEPQAETPAETPAQAEAPAAVAGQGEEPAAVAGQGEEPAAAPAQQAAAALAASATLHPALAAVLSQLHAEPDNDALRLAAARMSQALQATEQSLEQYRVLIRRERLLDDVVQDLQDMIAECGDPAIQRRLHRLLGDAYTKQNRISEAMEAYSWTPARAN